MARVDPRRLTEPAVLRRIETSRLIRFLTPFVAYLQARGMDKDALYNGEVDYDLLRDILAEPDEDTPHDLAVALYFVNEMSAQEIADDLVEKCAQLRVDLELEETASPADIAIEVWIKQPAVVEEAHATRLVTRRRNFRSFRGHDDPPKTLPLSDKNIPLIEGEMCSWFSGLLRGRSCRLTVHESGGLMWVLISHGERYTREPILQGDRRSSAVFRPEKIDVLFHDAATNELWVNADKREAQMYLGVLGIYLFDRPDYFGESAKYSLEPLRRERRLSLNCVDIDGIKDVHLIEVRSRLFGTPWLERTLRSDDVFEALERFGAELPPKATLTKAVFRVQFAESKKARMVHIVPPDRGSFGRDHDAPVIEQWLRARGFILPR